MHVVAGACPQASAVEKVLATLLPTAAFSGSPVATISDRGERYVVTVGEHAKTYVDSSRNCVERARVAAVFIALVLAPDAQPSPAPSATASSTPRASAAPAPKPPAVAQPPPRRRWLRVDARGALALAPAKGLTAPGGELGLAIGWGMFGASAECGWFSGASMNIEGGGSVLLRRFPCALGPALQLLPGAGRFEMNVAAGVALGGVLASGRGFSTNFDSSPRLEVGARAAVDAGLHLGAPEAGPAGTASLARLTPNIGFEITYYPVTYDLDVTLRGVASKTPSLWAGVTVGASWSVE
jgi:hypothetical protein